MEFTPLIPLFHFSKTEKTYFTKIRKEKSSLPKKEIKDKKIYII